MLTQAASSAKVDHLRGLKENLIMGGLIPAGTGFRLETLEDTAVEVEGGKEPVREATVVIPGGLQQLAQHQA